MEQSITLSTAQIHFLDTELALIHIPLELYSIFLQPILQFLLPTESSTTFQSSTGADNTRLRRPWVYEYPFVNISVTPVECSIACSRSVVQKIFVPILDALDITQRSKVAISHENYVVIQVDGEGLDAGQRVLELTGPLAMNGISIFFITTYFSDYILVPARCRAIVVQALEDRGFFFESNTEAFVSIASPLMNPDLHRRGSTSTASADFFDAARPPSTPPPSSIAELELRTFSLLKRRKVSPQVDPTLQLLQCAGRKDTLRSDMGEHASSSSNMAQLQLGMVKCLITTPHPRFFSLTLTDTEPASLLLERQLLENFGKGDDGSDVLLGSKEDVLIPITLDLRELPMESTGIVCGIAGRLAGGTNFGVMKTALNGHNHATSNGDVEDDLMGSVEMSYLSTARAGTVMVGEAELDRALAALRGVKEGQSGSVAIPSLPIENLSL